MEYEEILELAQQAHPTLNDFVTKKFKDTEREKIMVLEIKNLYELLSVCLKILKEDDPLELMGHDFKMMVLQNMPKTGINKEERDRDYILFSLSYLLTQLNSEKMIKFIGWLPISGLFSGRQAEAKEWINSYFNLLHKGVEEILIRTENNKKLAILYLITNIAWFFRTYYPIQFHRIEDEIDINTNRRIMKELVKIAYPK